MNRVSTETDGRIECGRFVICGILPSKRWPFTSQKATFYKLKDGLL